MNLSNLEVFERLHETAKGLLWMSESDYPFAAFVWEFGEKIVLENEIVLKMTKHSLDTRIQIIEFDSFFQGSVTPKYWHNSEEAETVKKYQELVRIMKQYLSDLKIYKVGEIEIDVYIIGKTNSGEYAGLATVSIET